MPTPQIQQLVRSLPFEKKLTGTGALLMVISLFLPWYQDVDTFRTGSVFTGMTGPLYLIGFTFLVLASLSIFLMVTDSLNKKAKIFPWKSSRLFFYSGIFSFYLLMVVNSVYFDRNFGVNITLKQSQFGMFIAFIAAAFWTVGGFLHMRAPGAALKEFQEEIDQPMISMPKVEQRKPRENLRNDQTDNEEAAVPQSQPAAMQAGSIHSQSRNSQPFRSDL